MKTSKFKNRKDWEAWFKQQPKDFRDKWKEMNDKFGDVVINQHKDKKEANDVLIGISDYKAAFSGDIEDIVDEESLVDSMQDIGLSLIEENIGEDGEVELYEFEYKDEFWGCKAIIDICPPSSASCEHEGVYHIEIDIPSHIEDEFEGLREAVDCAMITDKATSVASVVGIVHDALNLIHSNLIV